MPSNINVIYTSLKTEKYFQCSTIPLLRMRVYIFIRLAVVASQTCRLPQNSEKI